MKPSRSKLLPPRWIFILGAIALNLVLGVSPAFSQDAAPVQLLEGSLEPGQALIFLLPGLQGGQTVYLRMDAVSGNLDPIMGIIDPKVDPEELESAIETAFDRAISEGTDPLEAVEAVRDRYALAWDDDSGGGLAAALEFKVPSDGDYRLLIAGALSALGDETFGDFELRVGLDAPQVISGDVEPTGDIIAELDVETTPPGAGVQEIAGSLTQEKQSTFYELHNFNQGDTLFVFIEATSGDLRPNVVLYNFAQKPIRSANLDGTAKSASFEYAFPILSKNYRLGISGCCGDYRLLVGVNEPQVLTGDARPDGRQMIREPIEVKIGIILQQIIEVDQSNEFFTAQASMLMEWTDPALAFNPSDCQCDFITYTGNTLDEFVKSVGGRWPEFTLQNQQGNRWTQNKVVVVWSSGRARYFERFTTNFQVDFDFRKFPFDAQDFFIRVEQLFPEEFYKFSDLEGYSTISMEHGEDEFAISGFDTSITSEQSSTQAITSRFTFSFNAPRHQIYYIFQIFLPILLILVVSWITFFLRDYGRRIEVASANLLLFIAFSFSLSENYPRLGYVTFLDYIMAVMFVINSLVVAYNVWLKRMEMAGDEDKADRIDRVLDWVYPILLISLLLFGIWAFFVAGGELFNLA